MKTLSERPLASKGGCVDEDKLPLSSGIKVTTVFFFVLSFLDMAIAILPQTAPYNAKKEK